MAKLSTTALRQKSNELDKKKLKIEKAQYMTFKRVYNAMNDIVVGIIAKGQEPDYNAIVKQFRDEFTTAYKQAYRKAVIAFGFDLRKELKVKENKNFNIEYIVSKSYNDDRMITKAEVTSDEVDTVNNSFDEAMLLFILLESKRQAELIESTNEDMLRTSVRQSEQDYTDKIDYLDEKIRDEAGKLLLQGLATNVLIRNLIKTRKSLLQNRNKVISSTLRSKLNRSSKTRSEFLSEFAVGSAESKARDEEAKAVSDNTNSVVFKQWEATLDNRTRPWHRHADGQVARKEDFFIVGGESLRYPRDINASFRNTARCRCNAIYFMEEDDR